MGNFQKKTFRESERFSDALGRNRTHISRTGILRAIRCTTRAYNHIEPNKSSGVNYSAVFEPLQGLKATSLGNMSTVKLYYKSEMCRTILQKDKVF